MPVFLELEEDELEWIIACCRLHMNEGDFHTSIIHLLESGLVCFLWVRLLGIFSDARVGGNWHGA